MCLEWPLSQFKITVTFTFPLPAFTSQRRQCCLALSINPKLFCSKYMQFLQHMGLRLESNHFLLVNRQHLRCDRATGHNFLDLSQGLCCLSMVTSLPPFLRQCSLNSPHLWKGLHLSSANWRWGREIVRRILANTRNWPFQAHRQNIEDSKQNSSPGYRTLNVSSSSIPGI